MFFNVFNRVLVCAGIFALSACGGGEPFNGTTSSPPSVSGSAVQHAQSGAIAPDAAVSGESTPPAPTAAEREAEQSRMIAYEQSFSIEMNRRARERASQVQVQGQAQGQGEPVPPAAQPACQAGIDPALPAGCPDKLPAAAADVGTPVQAL